MSYANGKLTLHSPAPTTLFFSDRPDRLAVIVVMLAILFLSAAASAPPEQTGFLLYGAAVALVLAAIAGVVWVFARAHRSMEELKHEELTQQEQPETAIEEHG
jgi:hypothetical protein